MMASREDEIVCSGCDRTVADCKEGRGPYGGEIEAFPACKLCEACDEKHVPGDGCFRRPEVQS